MQHRFGRDDLFKNLGIKIPQNPATVKPANYSLPWADTGISCGRLQRINGSFRMALPKDSSGSIAGRRERPLTGLSDLSR